MGTNNGAVLAFHQLMNNGANNLRYNIVLVSEGYKEAEIPLFRSHCKGFLRKLFFTPPFSSLRCTFNVFALEVSSTNSGVDDPKTCGDGTPGSGARPATFFDSTVCAGGSSRRSISVNSVLVRNCVSGFLPQFNTILVLVNSKLDGGTTYGDLAVYTTQPGWEDTALHEFGHVLGLADEYSYYVSDKIDGGRTYSALDSIFRGFGLPTEPNVTDTSDLAKLKWGDLVAPATPVPTPPGFVGLFEGAKYYAYGLYRPEEICKMRDHNFPFCAVCSAAIIAALAPWTPTTTCVSPTATPASLSVKEIHYKKVMILPGRGGYTVTFNATTNLPSKPKWAYRLDVDPSWSGLPSMQTLLGEFYLGPIQVPINQFPSIYIYNHSAIIQAYVDEDDLDYWVPATPTFLSARSTKPIALPWPDNAANRIWNDYENDGNLGGPGFASINFGGIIAGNGWLYVGTRRNYTRIAVKLKLDQGFFGPDDDPAWGLQNISWKPTPDQSTDVTAFYDVTFDKNGLCWLNSDPTTVVDPNVGFSVSVNGTDAIGQPFKGTGWLVPTNVKYERSISTIEVEKIPPWEWPMIFDIQDKVLDVVLNGVSVKLTEKVLQIGKIKAKLRDARSF